MLRIVLCDDDAADLRHVEALTREFYGGGAEVYAFSSAGKVLRHVECGAGADIVLLDILMPEMNGTILAERLRRQGYRGRIGFLTSSNDYAAESYRVDAFGYLLKPVQRDALHTLLGRAADAPREDGPSFSIRQGRRVRKVPFAQFMYLEVRDHRLYFHLAGGEVLDAYATLAEYAPVLLREARCGRCHKSLIVNMDHVECLDGMLLHMPGGRQLPISRSFADFRAQYLRWVFEREEQP